MDCPTRAVGSDHICAGGSGRSNFGASRRTPVRPAQKTAGHSMLIAGLVTHQTHPSGVWVSVFPAQGTEGATGETAVAIPCIGRTTTKDSTNKAAKMRRNRILFMYHSLS